MFEFSHGPVRGTSLGDMSNLDERTVEGFGDEWAKFTHQGADEVELDELFEAYFSVFPWSSLSQSAVGADIGVGSGRWAQRVAPKVGHLHCVDASDKALEVARQQVAQTNVTFHLASVGALPFKTGSLDFAYSLGVLHHVPDTRAALFECARVLKPGAPFLVYLYYAFDNRPRWYRAVWRMSELLRARVSALPARQRFIVAEFLAASMYFPLARSARFFEKLGVDVENIPLSAYRDRSYYVMRTDALDRFGTSLEQRFTRVEITDMLRNAGFEEPTFHHAIPFWTAVAVKS